MLHNRLVFGIKQRTSKLRLTAQTGLILGRAFKMDCPLKEVKKKRQQISMLCFKPAISSRLQ